MRTRAISLLFGLALPAICSAAVDQETLDNMVNSAHFSADAYAMPNCSYPEGTKRLQVGFLAVDGQRKWIITTTRTMGGMACEVLCRTTSPALQAVKAVHEGYQEACSLNVDSILKDIQAALHTYPGYKVVVTGHSLGGAEVALCGTSIAHALGPGTVTAFSLAGPAAGNSQFAAYQDAGFPAGSFYRITSLNDTVPQALTPAEGYYHGGTEKAPGVVVGLAV